MSPRLLYDSAFAITHLCPRNAADEPRALLYRAGDVCVDLVICEDRNGAPLAYGQLVRAPGGTPLANVTVAVGACTAVTDPQGEFSLRLSHDDAPRISVHAPCGSFVCSVPGLERVT